MEFEFPSTRKVNDANNFAFLNLIFFTVGLEFPDLFSHEVSFGRFQESRFMLERTHRTSEKASFLD